MASSLIWFPVVGFALAGILWGFSASADFIMGGKSPQLAAFIIVTVSIILTGGLHLDGLADWADSLGCSPDRDRMLSVMKDSRIGTFGVLALVVNLLGKWIVITILSDSGIMIWLVGAYVVSRTIMVDLAVWLPYARSEGGTGAEIVREAQTNHRLWSMLSCILILLAVLGITGIAVFIIGFIIGRLFGYWCNNRIGGITGDLLGACSEIVETSLLLIGAVFG
ncbi:MAG TPA: adenosylcobinamide-GDP ribazoletransferase [bacterium]|nr:adenosylcobinamide-GDP ribazoletransferase [bacterium]